MPRLVLLVDVDASDGATDDTVPQLETLGAALAERAIAWARDRNRAPTRPDERMRVVVGTTVTADPDGRPFEQRISRDTAAALTRDRSASPDEADAMRMRLAAASLSAETAADIQRLQGKVTPRPDSTAPSDRSPR